MKLPFKESRCKNISVRYTDDILIHDGYFRRFIRWAYHKYINELHIPKEATVWLGYGLKDISEEYDGYGVTVSINLRRAGFLQEEVISNRDRIKFLQ